MHGKHEKRGSSPLRKLAYLILALAILVGLFYLALALTSHL